MSHPMFDRMTRRMEALQREIDKTHRAGEAGGATTAPPTKPPATAPQGILHAPVQRQNGTTRQRWFDALGREVAPPDGTDADLRIASVVIATSMTVEELEAWRQRNLGTESVGGSLVPADVWEQIGAALGPTSDPTR